MAVAIPVMAGKNLWQSLFELFGLALIFGQCRRVFHKIEHCAAVPTAGQGKRIQGFRDKLEIEAFRAFMAQLAKILLGKGFQAQDMEPGKQLPGNAERRIFGGCGQQGEFAGFQQGQEKILLGL